MTQSLKFEAVPRSLERRLETKIVPGLSRILAHLKSLGDPQETLKVIHVAGTNGKGSTCAILESVLRAAGYKVGFYLSPHLQSPRERIRFDGKEISRADFQRVLRRTLKQDPDENLTYFEILTSMAFQYFAEKKPDFTILETGLGGRLDATNVVKKPLASIISSIDFDHMNWLGSSIESIAFEKAGIIKFRRPVFCANLAEEALGVLRAEARRKGSPLFIVKKPWPCREIIWGGNRQILGSPKGESFALSLLGNRQGQNVALLRSLVFYLEETGVVKVSSRAWRVGLSSVYWPGRFEVVRVKNKIVILDGAHNPEAMRNLSRTWGKSPWARQPGAWMIAMMKDKDAASSLKEIAPWVRFLIVTGLSHPRAMPTQKLAAIARKVLPRAKIVEARDVERALAIWHNEKMSVLTVCGSFYLIEPVRLALKGS